MSELGGKIYRVAIILIFIIMVIGYYVLDMSIDRIAYIALPIALIAAAALAVVILFHEEAEDQDQ